MLWLGQDVKRSRALVAWVVAANSVIMDIVIFILFND